jgi:hypothetical protein
VFERPVRRTAASARLRRVVAERPTVFEPGRVNVPEGLGNESAVLLVHLKK